jgi:single-strand DNA-binding protein
MAGSINRVELLGRIGKDVETRYAQSGDAIANFSVATDESYKKDGEKVDKVEWHNVVVFGKLAELCGQYTAKGKRILVVGKLQTRKWEDKEGVTRYSTEVVVTGFDGTKVLFIDFADKDDDDEKRPARSEKKAEQKKSAPAKKQQADLGDDDIPF